jgi:hypothetical protein
VAFGTYVGHLRKRYSVDYAIRPENYTTIVDFLDAVSGIRPERYDAIILHCGVVDFSPRPVSGIRRVMESKAGRRSFDDLFASHRDYYAAPWPTTYDGEQTINLYSADYLSSVIIPRLARLENLIWISSNHFVRGWEGNYTRGRPSNIDEAVSSFEAALTCELSRVVDLRQWTDEQVRRFTVDNIHYTRAGFDEISRMIEFHVEDMLTARRTRAGRTTADEVRTP